MSDIDASIEQRIDALHDEAETLATLASHVSPEEATRLRTKATRLVHQAAVLRREIEED